PDASSPGPTNADAAQPVDILLVEDEPHDVELTLRAFKAAKLANRIHVVHDGAAALEFVFDRGAHRRQSEPLPHVILLDLNLPKVHGMEVLRRIKSDKRTQMIQVIVLAISRRDEHVREAMQLGADAYLVKPMDFPSFSKVTPQLNCYWSLL